MFYLVVLVLAVVGIMRSLRHRWRPPGGGAALLLLTILYWSAVHFVLFDDGRFHLPIVPIVAGFAAPATLPGGDHPAT